ncbi:MAG: hypothetical protein FWF29_12250, partial [Treponema sp.]|nr:hypothetical protein [Treponema sp.]
MILFIVLCLSLTGCGDKKPGAAVTAAAVIPPSEMSAGKNMAADARPESSVDAGRPGPVLYVLTAASDTCGDFWLRRTYAAVRDLNSSAAARTGALEEFLARQKTGSL